jgi:hypothetical protein
MRSFIVLAFVLATSPAIAGSRTGGGGGDGGGRLGKVSSGIDRATNHPSPPRPSSGGGGSSSPSSGDSRPSSSTVYVDDDGTTYPSYTGGSYTENRPPALWIKPRILVEADMFAGAQKVHESNGSLSVEASLVVQRAFRINAAVSHYFEEQMEDGRITMTVPSLTAGLKLGEMPKSKLWLEGGVVHVRTNDPAGSAAVTGSQLGVRIEHELNPNTSVIANGGAMLFSDMQAATGRLAVRFHHVEAGFRYLDFSVGPALFGPEIGFGF